MKVFMNVLVWKVMNSAAQNWALGLIFETTEAQIMKPKQFIKNNRTSNQRRGQCSQDILSTTASSSLWCHLWIANVCTSLWYVNNVEELIWFCRLDPKTIIMNTTKTDVFTSFVMIIFVWDPAKSFPWSSEFHIASLF